jgi:hypothetical protein
MNDFRRTLVSREPVADAVGGNEATVAAGYGLVVSVTYVLALQLFD